MAHDEADRPRGTPTDGGTARLSSAGPVTASTAGLPQSVTATTPQAGRPFPDQGPPGPEQRYGYPAPAYPNQGYPGGQYAAAPSTPFVPAGRPSRRTRGVILAACALLGTGIGVGAQRLTAPAHHKAATTAPTVAPTPVTVDVSSFDPKGSGFRQQDGAWRSQTYNDASFAGLKDGIGLLLDLGSARTLRSVNIAVQSGPITVELRAADSHASSADGYQRVGNAVQANGSTTLAASAGGSHRYWLVWVTHLSPADRAVISSVSAQA